MNLFVYGTLLFPEIRELVGGRDFRFQPASLEGFRVLKVQGATFPGAIKTGAKTDLAKGEVLFDLTENELSRFDAYEDTFYVRESVEALGDNGESISAMIYTVPDQLAGQILTEELWTQEWFIQNHRQEFFERIR